MEFDPSFQGQFLSQLCLDQSFFLAPSNGSSVLRDLRNPNLDDDVTIAPLSQLHHDLSQGNTIVQTNDDDNDALLTASISYPPLSTISAEISGGGGSTMLTKIAKDVACIKENDGVIIKGQWTPDEDSALKTLVKEYGMKKWCEIAKHFKGRIGKQCRERWFGHLRPNIRKGSWNEEEDMMLIKVHKEVGNKWAEIARRMEGRSDNSIKNHWNAIKRRRRINTHNFKSKRLNTYDVSLLKAYIKEVTPSTSSKSKEVKNSPNNNKKKGKPKMLLCSNDHVGDHPLLHNFQLPMYDLSNDSWVTKFYGGDAPTMEVDNNANEIPIVPMENNDGNL